MNIIGGAEPNFGFSFYCMGDVVGTNGWLFQLVSLISAIAAQLCGCAIMILHKLWHCEMLIQERFSVGTLKWGLLALRSQLRLLFSWRVSYRENTFRVLDS